MKEIIIKNDKGVMIRGKIFTYLIVIAVIVLFGITLVKDISTVKRDYLQETTGVVDVIEVTNTNVYTLKLEGSEITYVIANPNVSEDISTYNDNNCRLQFDPNNYYIYQLTFNDNTLYDSVEDFYKSSLISLILAIIVLAGSVTYLAVSLIKILTKKSEERYEYVEYMLTHNNLSTNKMLGTKSRTRSMNQMFNTATIIIFILLVVFALCQRYFVNMPNGNLIRWIVLGVIVAAGIGFIAYRFACEKKMPKIFADDYIDYLNNGSNGEFKQVFFNFKKEGLKVNLKENPLFINYHDLNLYTTVLFNKGFRECNIFLCSDMDESNLSMINVSAPVEEETQVEEYDVIEGDSAPINQNSKASERIEHDFIIQLTHESYKEILDNGIYIKGLEKLVENMEEEIKKHTDGIFGKPKVVKYLD